MEKDLISAVKYLRAEMQKDKEEILEALAELIEEPIEEPEEESESDNPFDETEDTKEDELPYDTAGTQVRPKDFPDYEGKRQVSTKDAPKKKTWLEKMKGDKKGDKKPDVSQADIDKGNF